MAGYAHPGLAERVDEAEGAVVVEGADGGGQPFESQELGCGALAVAFGLPPGQDADVLAEAAAAHRRAVAASPVGGDGVVAAVDVRDVAVSEAGEMVDEQGLAAVVG